MTILGLLALIIVCGGAVPLLMFLNSSHFMLMVLVSIAIGVIANKLLIPK